MSFSKSTRGRADGISQYDRREMNRFKLVAYMKDGTQRDVPSLVEWEELKTSGLVLRFEKVEVK